MAIRDHLKQTKLRAKIITVDPRSRRIEVVPDGGGVIQVAVYEIGNNFAWPREGEIWSIYREGLNWVLGNPVPSEHTDLRIEDLNPGEAIAPSTIYTAPNTTLARKYVQIIGNNQDLEYVINHNLAAKDITASISAIKTVGTNTVSYNVLDENSIRVVFSSAPPIDSYQVSVGEIGLASPADNSVSVAKTGVNNIGLAQGAFYLHSTVATSIPNVTNTLVPLAGVTFDISNGNNGTGYVVPVTGIYRVTGQWRSTDLISARVIPFIYVNESSRLQTTHYPTGADQAVVVAGLVKLVAGNTLSLVVRQDTGSSRTTQAGGDNTFLCGELVGRWA